MAACLQQLGGSPERVLNALLEGAPPPAAAGLDPQLSLAAWRAAADGGARRGKGTAAAAEAPSYDSEFPAAPPGVGPASTPAAPVAAALARGARAEGTTGAPCGGCRAALERTPRSANASPPVPRTEAVCRRPLCLRRVPARSQVPGRAGGHAALCLCPCTHSDHPAPCTPHTFPPAAKYLDVREETYREALLAAAREAEYEDEYDGAPRAWV